MTKVTVSDICKKINDSYVNNSNYSELNLNELPIYNSFNPEITRYLRLLLNYKLLDKKSDEPLNFRNKVVSDFTNNFNDLDGYYYNGDIVNLFTLAFNLKHVTPLDVNNTEYSFAFNDRCIEWLQDLNVYSTSSYFSFCINALFSDYDYKSENDVASNEHDLTIWKIQRNANYQITNRDNVWLALKYGIVVPTGNDNQFVDNKSLTLMELSYAYQVACNVELIPWVNSYVSNNLPCNTNGLQYVQDAAYLKGIISNLNDIDESYLTDTNLRNLFDVLQHSIKNVSIPSGFRFKHLNNNVVQAFYVKENPLNHMINQMYTLQYFDNTDDKPKYDVTQANDGEIFILQTPILDYNTSEFTSVDCMNSYAIKLTSDLAGHTQTFQPLSLNNEDNTSSFLVGVHGYFSGKSKTRWANQFALLTIDNNLSMDITYSNLNDLHRLVGFNTYRLEAMTDLQHNLLIIAAMSENGTITFTKYQLSDVFDHLKTNLVTNINDCKQIDNAFVIHNFNSVDKGIGSNQGYAYKDGYIYASSEFAPNSFKMLTLEYGTWKYFVSRFPRQIVKIPWGNTKRSDWKFVSLTNMNNYSIADLFHLISSNSNNYGTEIESLQFVGDKCYITIAFHGMTEYNANLNDANYIMCCQFE